MLYNERMISPDIFLMQADKICHELFEQFSENLFSRIELKQYEEAGTEENPLLQIVTRDNLSIDLEKTSEKYIASEPFSESGKTNYFVVYFSKEEKKTFEKYQTFFEQLLEQVFKYFIREYLDDNAYFYNGSIHSILARDAIDSLITEISRKCSKTDDFSLYDNVNLSLKNILNELSALTYEKTITQGLIYFTERPENADFQFEFKNYEEYGTFDLNNIRLLRKLIELTNIKDGIGIISDTKNIFGIGSIKDGTEYFSVTFDDDRKWTVFENGSELISIRNNALVFVNSLLTRKEFSAYASAVFPEKKDSEDIPNMYNILKALVKQKKGTILVVKKDAAEFIKKYQDLCMVINPVHLDEKNVERLSSIDGAIIMDENCICYGFGVVLDGLDTGAGNRARGSRYNSSERFYNLYKNNDNTDLMVFILSDDGNFNFFPEV